MMRRALAIAASVAMMLAAGEFAMTQTPNVQVQSNRVQNLPRSQKQPRVQDPGRPNLPLIKPSQALSIAMHAIPGSKAVGVKLLPGGNYAVTLKLNDQALRVIIDGDTGERR